MGYRSFGGGISPNFGCRVRDGGDLTYERLIEWQGALGDEGKKEWTLRTYVMAIKGFTRWANAHGFLKTDPGAQFTTPRLKVVLPVLPPFEVMEAALAAEPRLRNRAILVIGL